LRVALISHEFPPFFFGGVGSHCRDLAYNLAKMGIHVTVFAGKSDHVQIERISDFLTVIRLPYFDFPPRPVWFQIRNLQLFSRLLKKHDIVHVVDVHSGALPIRIFKKLERPIVTSIHAVPHIYLLKLYAQCPIKDFSIGDLGLAFLEYPYRALDTEYCLANSTHIVSCGSYALEKMRTYLKLNLQKASVIHNGINLEEIDRYLPNGLAAKIPRIVFVGRLFYLKGITYLINALALLKENLEHFSVEILGDGPMRGKIEKQISSLGLKNEVHLHGFVNDRYKLLAQIKGASAVVLPSLLEVGPSISLLEAMACRKPVIAFDMPFMREFIVNMQNGILAKPYDLDDLAQKMLLALTDQELCEKLGQSAHEYVTENHDWTKLAPKYISLYSMIRQRQL
jgi:glycosyltransferase involved in cell wall biosynthesis